MGSPSRTSGTALADYLLGTHPRIVSVFYRINRNKDLQDKAKAEDKKEGEEIQKLVKLHEWEQKKLEEVKREEKRNVMKAYREHQSNK